MERFSRTAKGYNPEEVNAFLDSVIAKVENMVAISSKKDEKIKELESEVLESKSYKDRILQYERMEETLNKAILMAQKTSDQIRLSAHQEGEAIVNEAKNNANRIVNEALLKADRVDREADLTKRNVTIFKRRLRDVIETQLELVDDIEKIEL